MSSSSRQLIRTVSNPRVAKASKKRKITPSTKSYKSMSGAMIRREYALARFPIKMTHRLKLMLWNNTGWENTTPSLAFAYSLTGVHYSLGGGAFVTIQFDNLNYLTPLFDEWRLIRVETTLTPSFESFDSNANRWMIPVFSAVDNNDADVTALADIFGYSNVKKHTVGLAGKEFKRVVMNPGTQQAVETTTFGFTSAAAKKISPWISCDSTSVAHYGTKWVVDPSTQQTWSMQVQFLFECFFEFRNTR